MISEKDITTEEFEIIEKEVCKDKTLEEISNLTTTLNPETVAIFGNYNHMLGK
jgi:hypothetical protein